MLLPETEISDTRKMAYPLFFHQCEQEIGIVCGEIAARRPPRRLRGAQGGGANRAPRSPTRICAQKDRISDCFSIRQREKLVYYNGTGILGRGVRKATLGSARRRSEPRSPTSICAHTIRIPDCFLKATRRVIHCKKKVY